MTRARVIGAGLSGLATAWCLADAGFDVEVIEAAAEPGGLIGSVVTPFGLVERAANAFVWSDTVAHWFRTLDIHPCFPSKSSRRRFIFRNGRPRRWPLRATETAALGTRVALGWSRGHLKPSGDETVAAWSDRALGHAATTWLVEPALQGIYGAPASRLAARAVFGDPRRRTRVLAAPPGGMGEFVERLVNTLTSRRVTFTLGARADALDPAVPTVVCTDAGAAAALLAPHAPELSAAIRSVQMNALLSATAFFEPHARDVHGFGVLFPRRAGIRALGVLFNADIFSGRGTARSETWIYGCDAESPLPTNDDVAAAIAKDRELFAGRSQRPLAVYVSGVDRAQHGSETARAAWLPIYDTAVLRVADRLSDLPPWLGLAGNYLGRLGVAKLLDVAEEAARRLTSSPRARA